MSSGRILHLSRLSSLSPPFGAGAEEPRYHPACWHCQPLISPVSLADDGFYTSMGFFPSLEGDSCPLMDPVSHQHRSLASITHGLCVPVNAFTDGSRHATSEVRYRL